MSFSAEWDAVYKQNLHNSTWPWSDLVSYFYRHARPASADFRVLELGCGAGANIPFFKSIGVSYYGIDGSSTIVSRLCERFPEYSETITTGDFTTEIPFDGNFDLIFDRASLTHNHSLGIRRCLDLAYQRLCVGGTYFGIHWFSSEHSDAKSGLQAEDSFTRNHLLSGPFKSVGRVHFSDRPHLIDLFSKFKVLALDHTCTRSTVPDQKFVLAYWNIAARKL